MQASILPTALSFPPTAAQFLKRLVAVASLLLAIVSSETLHAALPNGWTFTEFGSPGQPGTAEETAGTWTITGGGAGLCSTDQHVFVHRPFESDGTIIARIASLDAPDFFAQSGLMFRADLSPGGTAVMMMATATNGVSFQWRTGLGTGCSSYATGGTTVPFWLKLARLGSDFSGYYSTNGVDWIQLGRSETVEMPEPMRGGFVVTANNNAAVSKTVFTDFTVPPPLFGVYGETWNLSPTGGNSLDALTNSLLNPGWPDQPATNWFRTSFNTETNSGKVYFGTRLRAFLVPSLTGMYRFWIASDDTSELRLGADETGLDAQPIAWVSSAVLPGEWTRQTNQVSQPFYLLANRRYYLESRSQQSTASDHLEIRWQLPDSSIEEPLQTGSAAGTMLVPNTGKQMPISVFRQPTDLTIPDSQAAVFSLLSTTPGPVTYQWLANGTNLDVPNGSAQTGRLELTNAFLYHGIAFNCLVSNSIGMVTSTPALLSVVMDQTPPAALWSQYRSGTNVQVWFTEPIEPGSATNILNYRFLNGTTIYAVVLNPDQASVTLLTGTLTEGASYTLIINGIKDRASIPNTIAPDTRVTVFAGPYTPVAVGAPMPAGFIRASDGGYDLAAGGKDIGGTASDDFLFAFEVKVGDFDVRTRINSESQTDLFAKAGLMAREDLTPSSRFTATLATPSMAGAFFSARTSPGLKAVSSGNARVNFPDMWLRLQRAGDVFTGYASYDGRAWQQLGTATVSMTNRILLGMAACSRNTNQLLTAQFRNLSPVTNAASGVLASNGETPGPSSRKTGLSLTEIMYHPPKRDDDRNLEYVEIFNSQPWFEDISSFSLDGDISFTFPTNTFLPAGACIVVAASPADLQAVTGVENVAGPYTKSLPNDSGHIRLRDRWGSVLLDVHYGSKRPWPPQADGAGHSLTLLNPSYGEDDPRAWAASDVKGGSPGRLDGTAPEPARGVLINEFLAHTDPPQVDFVELYNSTLTPVDVSGCGITDDPDLIKFHIPQGTTIAAGACLVFDENRLGFRLSAEGETIYLLNANDTRVLDCVRYSGQANGVSTGSTPDGSPDFRPLTMPTPGKPNAPALVREVVINEIMYDPISGNSDDQYVELYNRGSSSVPLAAWKFTSGIAYQFPAGAAIPADGYVVIAKNRSRILANYPGLSSSIVYGDFQGRISGKGERLVLSMADQVVTTNAQGIAVSNWIYIPVSEVQFETGGRWGEWANGGGSSLELVDPRSDESKAANWADSDETTKAPWTLIETTGMLDNGNGSYSPSQLHVFLQGPGECLVDNVEVFPVGEATRIANGTFSSGTTGWTFQGTHRSSSAESSGGYGGGGCLHVRASGRGDTGANRIRTQISPSLATYSMATIRARVRWLKGNPELLLRIQGNWLEAAGRMALPANPGTPGARNSRFKSNAGPAIFDVVHSPVLPSVGQPITVKARALDPDGLAALNLVYRNDSASTPAQSVPMLDNGVPPDQKAGDGIFTAQIPAQTSRSILAFYVEATDASTASTSSRFPSDAPTRECLVGVGESLPSGTLGTYRLWITRATANYWSSREKNSNDPVDATFVYGDSRVVYNVRTLYSGSPFHTSSYTSPTGAICDYVISFPDDEKFLGANDFVLASTGNLGSDETAQREQAGLWLLREIGAPSLYRRYINVFVNSVKRGLIMEDAQQPNSDVVEQYFPDDADGELHKIEDWFEFDNAGSSFNYITATLQNFRTFDGSKKLARYRWNWRPRAVKRSSSDFTNLFLLVDAVSSVRPEPYTQAVNSMANIDEWMKTLALERLVGNWDSWGYNRGKNMYAYKPQHGPWHLIAWDIDFVLDRGDGPSTGLFGGQDPAVNTMMQHPPFVRAYWRAFYDLLNGPMQDSRVIPLLDAKYAGLTGNGIAVSSPGPIKTYVAQRRTYVQSQLATVNAAFAASASVVSNNIIVLTGTAPVQVKDIRFNGLLLPVTWTSTTGWTARVPLKPGSTSVLVEGVGSSGSLVASRVVPAVYNGQPPSPVGQVVFSEIMVSAPMPGAEYVELFNRSTTNTFDLSGWTINGLGYTFPQGSMLLPNNYLVLAADRSAFGAAYGVLTPVYGIYPGALQKDGETLTLFQPQGSGDPLSVAKVRYDSIQPWPTPGSNTYSLQLIDSGQDNWRVANWGTATTNVLSGPKWVYVSVSGAPTTSRLYLYLQSPGDIYLDDIKLVAGYTAEVGANLVANGDFENSTNSWIATTNFSKSATDARVAHSGSSSLHMIATAAGAGSGNSIYQDITPALLNGQPYTLSFWYLQTTNGGPVTVRLSGSGISTGNIDPSPAKPAPVAPFTPGTPNSIARSISPFPTLWINEIQPENINGIQNSLGQRAPWIELFNPTTNSASLDNLYLTTNYQNMALWAFPSNVVIGPRQFKVIFADGQPSSSGELHASFALSKSAGSIALVRRLSGSAPEVLDYINYTNVRPNRSYGSSPDGQSFTRREFYYATAGATNNAASPLITVRINEWMADNTGALQDPSDGDFEDWFELYNPTDSTIDVGGYFLTDTLTNQFQFKIPETGQYILPPHGFLLVWADGEPDQNSTNSSFLHANFKLDRGGESIGLFGADGTPIDIVSFGRQAPDLSEGRFPDGGSTIEFMSAATPLTNNVAPNTPPRLSAIADRVATVGQPVSLIATAVDTDVPPQTLQFSLDAGSAAGASIDPWTGVFQWTPAVAGTNVFAVIVTDSGLPHLSDSKIFQIVAWPPLQFETATLTGTLLRLSWSSIPGERYQVEFTANLSGPAWVPASTVMTGNGSVLTFTDNIVSHGDAGFYRVIILP